MSGKKSSARSKDAQAAVGNLLAKGLVVARQDVNGKVVYFPADCAPSPGPFELESYRRGLENDESRLELPCAASSALDLHRRVPIGMKALYGTAMPLLGRNGLVGSAEMKQAQAAVVDPTRRRR
jgi:hypothetical protein